MLHNLTSVPTLVIYKVIVREVRNIIYLYGLDDILGSQTNFECGLAATRHSIHINESKFNFKSCETLCIQFCKVVKLFVNQLVPTPQKRFTTLQEIQKEFSQLCEKIFITLLRIFFQCFTTLRQKDFTTLQNKFTM